jgi:hypothetical protein
MPFQNVTVRQLADGKTKRNRGESEYLPGMCLNEDFRLKSDSWPGSVRPTAVSLLSDFSFAFIYSFLMR